MRSLFFPFFVLFFCASLSGAESPRLWGRLEPGSHAVGFRLDEVIDRTRPGSSARPPERGRSVRIYVWYPTDDRARSRLKIRDFARMAAADFGPIDRIDRGGGKEFPLPVPLARGLEKEALDRLLETRTAAARNVAPSSGPFPLLVVGQGLYYESPLTHLVLCEYLASHGYVVATCPLEGTGSRLVNLTVVDLETQIRDMELVLSTLCGQGFVDPDSLGLIGYDLGGMASLTLSMRNRNVDALLTLDAGILFGHFSQLPQNHPHYDESLFAIPWMHMTQARFVPARDAPGDRTSLLDRKNHGDSYLVLVDTACHGAFTSYAAFGIEGPVRGYWGPAAADRIGIHHALCALGVRFFDAYLQGSTGARASLHETPESLGFSGAIEEIRRKGGTARPPREDDLLNLIIEKGISPAAPVIERAAREFPGRSLIKEDVLNWLGYHFLYWWGRTEEAVGVFELNAKLHPDSANAFDSLAEACDVVGRKKKAIENYKKSLELNPRNQNAVRNLERLGAEH